MNDIVNQPGTAIIASTPEDVSTQFEFTADTLRAAVADLAQRLADAARAT